MTDTVRITEIFYSLQGESRTIGLPTVFVRLTGCPLRCHYCDTAYAFHGGKSISIDAVLAEVAQYKPRYVCVTGGEPLAQKSCWPLLTQLCDADYQVSLETSGAMSCEGVDDRVVKVIDLKTPDSGEQSRNDYSNMQRLTPQDQVKFVICSRVDYDWARFAIDQYNLLSKGCEILFSPSHGQVSPRDLAEWILADNLAVRMQLQMHKIIWNDEPGH